MVSRARPVSSRSQVWGQQVRARFLRQDLAAAVAPRLQMLPQPPRWPSLCLQEWPQHQPPHRVIAACVPCPTPLASGQGTDEARGSPPPRPSQRRGSHCLRGGAWGAGFPHVASPSPAAASPYRTGEASAPRLTIAVAPRSPRVRLRRQGTALSCPCYLMPPQSRGGLVGQTLSQLRVLPRRAA